MQFKSEPLEKLQPTMDATFHFMFTFGPKMFDLRNLDVNSYNVEHVALLLRGLSSCKEQINGYNECLARCIDVCWKNGIHADRILFGMIPRDELELLSEMGSNLFKEITEKFLFQKITPTLLLNVEITCNNMLLRNPKMTFSGIKISRFITEVDRFNKNRIIITPIDLDEKRIPSQLYIG